MTFSERLDEALGVSGSSKVSNDGPVYLGSFSAKRGRRGARYRLSDGSEFNVVLVNPGRGWVPWTEIEGMRDLTADEVESLIELDTRTEHASGRQISYMKMPVQFSDD